MNGEIKKAIREFAEKFRECFDLSTPITKDDLMKVIEDIGGSVTVDPRLEYDFIIIKTGDESFVFIMSKEYHHCPDRNTFALARAIGTLIFKYGYLADEKTWNSVPVCDYREVHTRMGVCTDKEKRIGSYRVDPMFEKLIEEETK